MQSMLCSQKLHNREVVNREVAGKFQIIWRLNNTLLKAHGSGSKNKFEEKNKHVFNKLKEKYNLTKFVGCIESSAEREFYTTECVYWKRKKI